MKSEGDFLPHAPGYTARVTYPDEFVVGGNCMEVRGFFIYKKRVRYPNIFEEFWTDEQLFDAGLFLER